MQVLLFSLLMIAGSTFASQTTGNEVPKIRVLVVTGGHEFNTETFQAMIAALDSTIEGKTVSFPEAFCYFEPSRRHEYDVLVFYHMWQEADKSGMENLLNTIAGGKPLVVLHHSICAFDGYDAYGQMIGGKYFHKVDTFAGQLFQPSTYQHDVQVNIRIVSMDHPITRGIDDFVLFDEVYGGLWVDPTVVPLLKTNHPQSIPVIGWTKNYHTTRLAVLQPGHDTPAFTDEVYRKLVRQAIQWVYSGR